MASMPAGILILVCWVSLGVYWNISARSIKSAAEQQNLAARLARMPVWVGCVLGLLVAIWSRKVLGAEWSRDVELKQGHKLVERGPYRLMRHPIYTGHLLMGLGTAIASGSLVAFAGLASFVGGFWIKLNQEERLLLRGFPDEYPAYKERVKALIPYLF